MKPLLQALCVALALSACAAHSPPVEEAMGEASDWRSAATEDDRARLRNWRDVWVKAVAQARSAGHGAEIAAEGVLLEPDSGVAPVGLAIGEYRCRTIKVGSPSDLLPYVAYPPFRCRIEPDKAGLGFVKLTGSQRPVGRIFPDTARRMVFLGTLQLGDERGALRYGHDRDRDLAGIVERVGTRRWRIAFPSPRFESLLDVIELVPAS